MVDFKDQWFVREGKLAAAESHGDTWRRRAVAAEDEVEKLRLEVQRLQTELSWFEQ